MSEGKIISKEQDIIDYDDLEQSLEADLRESLEQVELLEEEKQKIGNPEYLGNTIMQVVWDQFIMQVGSVAGDDFIKENRGLPLDLSKDAHIQTTENFAAGKIATHNTSIDYQKRYEDSKNGTTVNKYGKEVIKRETRQAFDKGRKMGSVQVNMDHSIPVAEIVKDKAAAAHLDMQEKIDFANSDTNLNPLDAAANHSKRDKPMKEWLDTERDGKTPDERFAGVDRDELLKKDEEARDAFDEIKKEGEKRSIETGKQSRKAEAFRIGGKALRAAVMAAFMNWIRILIGKLITWLRKKKRSLQSLIEAVKESVKEFIKNLKQTVLNMSEAVASTMLTAIGNPLVGFIQKLWVMLKQGGRSVKEAVDYLRDPKNKGKPFDVALLEIGKIVVAGLAAIGAMMLGEIIEKSLGAIPGFAFPIPLLGSLASIVGMFLGAVIAGIAGALVLRWIDSMIAERARNQLAVQQIGQRNEIVSVAGQLVVLNEDRLRLQKTATAKSVSDRHDQSFEQIDSITKKLEDGGNSQMVDDINRLLSEI